MTNFTESDERNIIDHLARAEPFEKGVVSQLREQAKMLEELNRNVTTLLTKVAVLEFKASVWGALGGALTALGVMALTFLKNM